MVAALAGNGVLTVVKFGAFALSGSGAIFSEAIHSLADTSNQALLLAGIHRSERPADTLFQYGYGGDRYLYALFSAVGIFVLGCGVTVYHGINNLIHPPDLAMSWIPVAVLIFSFVVEFGVLMSAARVVWADKGETSLLDYLKKTTDPTASAVLLEDSVACVGVLVALAGIGLTHYTGNPIYDALGGIVIGIMLGLVAVWLGVRNRELLLGPSIDPETQREVEAFLLAQPSVMRVRKARSRLVGADRFRFKAELDFDGRYLGEKQARIVHERAEGLTDEAARVQFAKDFGEELMDELGREIDRIEAQLAERFPRIVYVDLEAD